MKNLIRITALVGIFVVAVLAFKCTATTSKEETTTDSTETVVDTVAVTTDTTASK